MTRQQNEARNHGFECPDAIKLGPSYVDVLAERRHELAGDKA